MTLLLANSMTSISQHVTYDDDDDPALFLRGEEMRSRSVISTNRAVFALLQLFCHFRVVVVNK